jgi:NAD(P)-dependent dehydrogenase (short-subunit alcohol dehydrogenase family)
MSLQREENFPESVNPQSHDAPGAEHMMDPAPDFGEESYVGFGRLKDKVAVVTGGDSGIGRAVCIAFAKEGAHVVCTYLNEHDDANCTKEMVEKIGTRCLLVDGDIRDEGVRRNIISRCMDDFGKIDILVNNAAHQGKAKDSFLDIELGRIEFTFETNIVAAFRLCQMAVPHMKPGSSIINVSSVQAYYPGASILDYACTKGALVALTKGLSKELTEKNIRVNSIAPGPVWTPLVAASFPKEKLEGFGKNYPKGRPAQPVEVSPSFVFLASSDASYISGEILGVAGGEPLA